MDLFSLFKFCCASFVMGNMFFMTWESECSSKKGYCRGFDNLLIILANKDLLIMMYNHLSCLVAWLVCSLYLKMFYFSLVDYFLWYLFVKLNWNRKYCENVILHLNVLKIICTCIAWDVRASCSLQLTSSSFCEQSRTNCVKQKRAM